MPLDLFDGSLSVDHWLFDAESGSFVRAMGKLETCFAFDGALYLSSMSEKDLANPQDSTTASQTVC